MMYDSEIGFRAGTCTPFLFYDLDYEIKTPLVIHPVCGRTASLYDNRTDEREQLVKGLMKEVKKVNGIFSFVFSNKDFTSAKKNKWWKELFSQTS